ncbi:hypothetical protein ACJW31_01G359500 [Castanea mollissima]
MDNIDCVVQYKSSILTINQEQQPHCQTSSYQVNPSSPLAKDQKNKKQQIHNQQATTTKSHHHHREPEQPRRTGTSAVTAEAKIENRGTKPENPTKKTQTDTTK